MTEIRPFGEADVAAVAALFIEVFGAGAAHTATGVGTELRKVYLQHPWRDAGVPSLVADRDGEVIAFIGAVPVPMRLAGRPVRSAIGGNLMASPRVHDPMATILMLRRFFQGGQDITLTDTASTDAAKLWGGLGGRVGRFGTLRWVLPLRPAAMAAVLATRHRPGPQRIGRALGRPLDAILTRPARRRGAALTGKVRELAVDELFAVLRAAPPRTSFRYDGDEAGLEWLVGMCARKEQYGPLRQIAVVDAGGQHRGVALYYPNPGDLAQVLALQAPGDRCAELLEHLRHDALDQGSVGLSGQADPALLDLLGGRSAVYLNHREYLAVHSADPALGTPLVAGEIGVARLYSDWWTRFQGDVLDDRTITASG